MKKSDLASKEDISVWYKFRPRLDIWLSRSKGKSYFHRNPDESWYGGKPFYNGFFIYLQLHIFAIHIKYIKYRLKL